MNDMAFKFREEIVGKRFLSIRSTGKLKLNRISDWDWRAGIVRAVTSKDLSCPEVSVLVEFDEFEWDRREWIKLSTNFHVFLVEKTVVWANRIQSDKSSREPALSFIPVVDKVGINKSLIKPVEFLSDRTILTVEERDTKIFRESDLPQIKANNEEAYLAAKQWFEYQDGQQILLQTPFVLMGYRVEVYRSEGTTQWYTAVIMSYNDQTQELQVTDDTVLEQHLEDPSLVQIKLIGDGVVDSIRGGVRVSRTRRSYQPNKPETSSSTPHVNRSVTSPRGPAVSPKPTPPSLKTQPNHPRSKGRQSKPVSPVGTPTEEFEAKLPEVKEKLVKSRTPRDRKRRSEEPEIKKAATRSATASPSPSKRVRPQQESTPLLSGRKTPQKQLFEKLSEACASLESAKAKASKINSDKAPAKNQPKAVIADKPDTRSDSPATETKAKQPKVIRNFNTGKKTEVQAPIKRADKTNTEAPPKIQKSKKEKQLADQTTKSDVSPAAQELKTEVTEKEVIKRRKKEKLPKGKNTTEDSPKPKVVLHQEKAKDSPAAKAKASPAAKKSIPAAKAKESPAAKYALKVRDEKPVVSTPVASTSSDIIVISESKDSKLPKDSKDTKPLPKPTTSRPTPPVEVKKPEVIKQVVNIKTVAAKPIADKPIVEKPVADKSIVDKPIVDTPKVIVDKPKTIVDNKPTTKLDGTAAKVPENGDKNKSKLDCDSVKIDTKTGPVSRDNKDVASKVSDVKEGVVKERPKTSPSLVSPSTSDPDKSANKLDDKQDMHYKKFHLLGDYSKKDGSPPESGASATSTSEPSKTQITSTAGINLNQSLTDQLSRRAKDIEIQKWVNKTQPDYPVKIHENIPTSASPSAPKPSPKPQDLSGAGRINRNNGNVIPSNPRISDKSDNKSETISRAGEVRTDSRMPTSSSPLLIDKTKPVEPYRDPELLKKDKLHRMQRDQQDRRVTTPVAQPSGGSYQSQVHTPIPSPHGSSSASSITPSAAGLMTGFPYPHHMAAAQAAGLSGYPGLDPNALQALSSPMHPAALQQLQLQLQLQQGMIPSAYAAAALHQSNIHTRQLEMLWTQKFPNHSLPPPWMLHQYQDELLRDIHLQQQHGLLERERREREIREKEEREREIADREREERERERKEKEENERLERERIEKERLDRERKEKERLHREEQERQERKKILMESAAEAVDKHFEASLSRLSNPKHKALSKGTWMPTSVVPRQPPSKPPVSGESGSSAFTQVASHSPSVDRKADELKLPPEQQAMMAHMREMEEKAKMDPNYFKALSQDPAKLQSFYQSYYASMAKAAASQGVPPVSSAPSESSANSSGTKSEPNYSLYGYQPFHHTYISPDRLAHGLKEEAKSEHGDKLSPHDKHRLKSPPPLIKDEHGSKASSVIVENKSKDLMHGGGAHGSITLGTPGMRQPLPAHTKPPVNMPRGHPAHSGSRNLVTSPNSISPNSNQPLDLQSPQARARAGTPPKSQSRQQQPISDMHMAYLNALNRPPSQSSLPKTSPHSNPSLPYNLSTNPNMRPEHRGEMPPQRGNQQVSPNQGSNNKRREESQLPSNSKKPKQDGPPSTVPSTAPNRSSGSSYIDTFRSFVENAVQSAFYQDTIEFGGRQFKTGGHPPQNQHPQSGGTHLPPSGAPLRPGFHPAQHKLPTSSPSQASTQPQKAAPSPVANAIHSQPTSLPPTTTSPQSSSLTTSSTSHQPLPPNSRPIKSSSPAVSITTTASNNNPVGSPLAVTSTSPVTSQPITSTPQFISSLQRPAPPSTPGAASISSTSSLMETINRVANGCIDTDSDTLSAPSPPPHMRGLENHHAASPKHSGNATKFKKAWLQRYSEAKVSTENPDTPKNPESITDTENTRDSHTTEPINPDNENTSDSNSKPEKVKDCYVNCSYISPTKEGGNKSPISVITDLTKAPKQEDESTTSASEAESQGTQGSAKRKKSKHKKQAEPTKKPKLSDNEDSNSSVKTKKAKKNKVKKEEKKERIISDCEAKLAEKKRKKKEEGKGKGQVLVDSPSSILAKKPLNKDCQAKLKKTQEPFIQADPCSISTPKLTKCRECKLTPLQKNKGIPNNIFCRFYAFRRLRYNPKGSLTTAGFSEPADADADDIELWFPRLPLIEPAFESEMAKYIISHVGDKFCELVEQERQAMSWVNLDTKIAWKRAVQGVREMCDVCETSLFNMHWVCHKCGFVVCIDCYRLRIKKGGACQDAKCKTCDPNTGSRWLKCSSNKQAHEPEKLMITQIIPSDALWVLGRMVHEVRDKYDINSSCPCRENRVEDILASKNGITQKIISDVKKEPLVNGIDGGDVKNKKKSAFGEHLSSMNGSPMFSPLNLLAEVADQASEQDKDKVKKEITGNGDISESEVKADKNGQCSTLRDLLTRQGAGVKNAQNDNAKRPVAPINNTFDDMIQKVVEKSQNIKSDAPIKRIQLTHYVPKNGISMQGRDVPIPTYTLKETSVLYPDVPHAWLDHGRLLRLLEPQLKANIKLFQQQWRRGQPVIISNCNKHLNSDLWLPKHFSKEFGHIENELVDCETHDVIVGHTIGDFWDGFEKLAYRIQSVDGRPLILKLKDWPSTEDFAETMPQRYQDLMSGLPLPEYTHRNGVFNLASRLPDFFVKPDLGPKMYNAYGSAQHPEKGTTNLHLDVSDAVNVMVYCGAPTDDKEHKENKAALRVIDEAGCCDFTKQRVKEAGNKPGALWHIYDPQDADKIRDFFNMVATEKGEKIEPHHDPIHDQSGYLTKELRKRLLEEYNVQGYTIVQCQGDAVFIPAGAPHQVQNLHSCVKAAEDFVSPENMAACFKMTQEFRHLSDTHSNHEDKLQIKNMIYHAVKDAVAMLQ